MRLDVRSKVLLVLFANLTFLLRVTGWIEAMLILGLAVIIAFAARVKMSLSYVSIYLLLLAVDTFLLDWLPYLPIRMLTAFATAGRFMLPSLMAGSLLLTTSSAYDLIHGLRKWRLPESLLLTLAVLLRFLPAIKEDAKIINRSLRLRGVFLRKRAILLQPVPYFEYMMVPLLMSLMRTVQDLTIASLTKGLALKKGSTEAFTSHFRLLDWSICIWMLGMLAWMLRP